MDATTRKKEIIRIMGENNTIKILELSKRLGVTRETIRRDLYDLERQKLVKVVRGGAILNAPINETNYERRLKQNIKEKKSIANKAINYIETGDTVYLDFGTTSYYLAEKLLNRKNITVITNSLPIIELLYRHKDITLIALGGVVRSNEGSLSGYISDNILNKINVNIGFFCGSGLDPNFGLSNHHIGESNLTRKLVKHCQNVIVGIDHTKFGNVFINKILDLREIDILITDKLTDQNLIKEISSATLLEQTFQ